MPASKQKPWSVEATGPVDKLYELLKEDFDQNIVVKEEIEFPLTLRIGSPIRQLPKSKQPKGKKLRAIVDDQTSLQFRMAIKNVQFMLQMHKGKTHVRIDGGPKGVTVKVEDV